jgi:hypothetical protein
MMQGMLGDRTADSMMWSMGLLGVLVIIVLVLAAIALAKYIFSGR